MLKQDLIIQIMNEKAIALIGHYRKKKMKK